MILNLNQMHNHIMENLFLLHAYMNSRSNNKSINLYFFKVVKKVNRPQWGTPPFLIPKKETPVRFISDLENLTNVSYVNRIPHLRSNISY